MPDNEVSTQPMNLPSAIRRIGRTGLKSYMGIIHEQELPQLQNVLVRMRIFREMRLDPTIGILEQAITRVLLAADFSTTPAGNTLADKYAADLLWDIMNNMDTEWYEHVEDALEHLWFGFAICQMVMKFRKDGNIGLADLMPMAQEMTFRWGRQDESGKVSGIEMLDPVTGTIYRVPSEKFLHFTDRGRKRNPEGEGMCLHVWRSWRYKTNLQEIEAIGIERDMGGMPVFKIPDKPSEQEKQDIMEQARAMRADENAGLIVYGEQEVHPYETEGKMYDVRKVIEDYAWDILAYSGAQWLKLGQDNGTQALVQGTTDMFGLYLRAIQERMLSVWHKQMIPTLAIFNPKLTTPNGTPKITWADPGVPDVKAILEAFASGVNSGVITPTQADEVHIRSILDLPELPAGMGQDSRVPNAADPLKMRIADLQSREQPAAMLMEAAANKFKSFTFSKADYSDGFMRLPLAGFDGSVTIELVDGQYIRQNLYQDFTEGGNDLAYDGRRVPFKLPANHVWIDFDVNSSEVMGVIGHELSERQAMIKRTQDFIQANGVKPSLDEIQAIYDECHDIANGVEAEIDAHPEASMDRIRALVAEQPKSLNFEGFKEDEHPRGKEGTSEGGQFVPKGGGSTAVAEKAKKKPLRGAAALGNEVILYGGLPMRRADVYKDVLKETGSTKAAEMFAFGPHANLAPEGTEPLSLEDYRKEVGDTEGALTGEEWVAALSEDEKNSIASWQTHHWDEMRQVQITGKGRPEIQTELAALDAAMAKDGMFQGTVYRGLSDLSEDDYNKIINGKTIRLEAHSSSTKDAKTALEFASFGNGKGVIFQIKAKSGVDITPVSVDAFKNQQEVVLQKGKKYKIVSKREADYKEFYPAGTKVRPGKVTVLSMEEI